MRSTMSGKYILLTVADVPFDRYAPYERGGPPKVTNTEWSTSRTSGDRADGRVTLNVHRWDDAACASIKHLLDGTVYDTHRDAERAAYEAGLTAYMLNIEHVADYALGSA